MNEAAETLVNGAKHVPPWVWNMLVVFVALGGFLYHESVEQASWRQHTKDMEASIYHRIVAIGKDQTAMKVQIAEVFARLNHIETRLGRIESKLDRLLSGRNVE